MPPSPNEPGRWNASTLLLLAALLLGAFLLGRYLGRTPRPPEGTPPVPSPTATTGPVSVAQPAPAQPRVCLIIDDAGYQRGAALDHLYRIHVPLTVSIIPDVEYSKVLAEEFPSHGIEVMCHMPMEGHEKGMVGSDYKDFLKTGMSPDAVKQTLERALNDLPNCKGLNNHMGSVATADLSLMQEVCGELKERGLYIIDSRTSPKVVVEQAAREAHIPFAHRDIFLDNMETPGAILRQLDQTAAYAKRHGLAVAIGHYKLITLETLEEAVPRLKDQGLEFVYASQIVKEE